MVYRDYARTRTREPDSPHDHERHTTPGVPSQQEVVASFFATVNDLRTTRPEGSIVGTYKRVDRKIKPVPGVFPEDARVTRKFPEDPLASLPVLPEQPPDFIPGERLTLENIKELHINKDGFLWPEEEKLFKHIFKLNEKSLAFDESQRGTLREDYFSPYIIPTIPHIPLGTQKYPNSHRGSGNEVIKLLRGKDGSRSLRTESSILSFKMVLRIKEEREAQDRA